MVVGHSVLALLAWFHLWSVQARVLVLERSIDCDVNIDCESTRTYLFLPLVEAWRTPIALTPSAFLPFALRWAITSSSARFGVNIKVIWAVYNSRTVVSTPPP